MVFPILIFASLSTLLCIEALDVQCKYVVANRWPTLKNLYTCEASLSFNDHPRRIESVTGNHTTGKVNVNVQSFIISGQDTVMDFPLDLHKFFPNLEAIYITGTGIETVAKEHFYGLPNLKSVDFGGALGNKIRSIGNNPFCFQANKLVGISFYNNPVEHIGFDFLEFMSKLNHLHFHGSKCYNMITDNFQQMAATIKHEVTERCFPTLEMVQEKRIDDLHRSYVILNENCNLRFDNFGNDLTEIKNQHNLMDKRISKISSECCTAEPFFKK